MYLSEVDFSNDNGVGVGNMDINSNHSRSHNIF